MRPSGTVTEIWRLKDNAPKFYQIVFSQPDMEENFPTSSRFADNFTIAQNLSGEDTAPSPPAWKPLKP